MVLAAPFAYAEAPALPLISPYKPLEVAEMGTESSVLCSCVLWLRSAFGVPVYGDAADLRPNITLYEARSGDLALFKYKSGIGHVAIIESFGAGFFTVREANYKKCEEGRRDVKLDDPALVGFLRL